MAADASDEYAVSIIVDLVNLVFYFHSCRVEDRSQSQNKLSKLMDELKSEVAALIDTSGARTLTQGMGARTLMASLADALPRLPDGAADQLMEHCFSSLFLEDVLLRSLATLTIGKGCVVGSTPPSEMFRSRLNMFCSRLNESLSHPNELIVTQVRRRLVVFFPSLNTPQASTTLASLARAKLLATDFCLGILQPYGQRLRDPRRRAPFPSSSLFCVVVVAVFLQISLLFSSPSDAPSRT